MRLIEGILIMLFLGMGLLFWLFLLAISVATWPIRFIYRLINRWFDAKYQCW